MRTGRAARPLNLIDHYILILDRSWSMRRHRGKVIQAVDGYVRHLAARSREVEREIRITVYTFSDPGRAECLLYDMDVLRLPSIEDLYEPDGNTALIEAVLLAFSEMRQVFTLHGDHAFFFVLFSDGENNQGGSPRQLSGEIEDSPDNWTVAAMVPDQDAVFEAKRCGFPAGNIRVWDTASDDGFLEAGRALVEVTDDFIDARARGVRGSKTLFQAKAVTDADVRALVVLTEGSYQVFPVTAGWVSTHPGARIDEFVAEHAGAYVSGRAYYQLTKTVLIQEKKQLAVMDGSGRIRTGPRGQLGAMLGIPDSRAKVKPSMNGLKVLVQSTSYNRRLEPGTVVLVLR